MCDDASLQIKRLLIVLNSRVCFITLAVVYTDPKPAVVHEDIWLKMNLMNRKHLVVKYSVLEKKLIYQLYNQDSLVFSTSHNHTFSHCQ